MKSKLKIKVLVGIIFFLLFINLKCNSFAASANISCDTKMVTGETKTITVTGNAVQWNLTLYIDGVAVATNRELENYEGNIGINFSAQYTPSSEGNKKVELKGSITDADVNSATITSFPGKTISVSAPTPSTQTSPPSTPATPTKSNNANLSNLVVKPVDFTGFRVSKTSGYSVTVDNDVTEVQIIPTLADPKAKYAISGNTNLKEGTNVVKITVTAEDGTKKTYQVNVIRTVASGEVTPNTSEDPADTTGDETTIGLSKLEIKGMKLSPEFSTNVYRYIVWLEDKKIAGLSEVKDLIEAEVNFEGGTFEIIGEEEFNGTENEVIISVKDADGREIAIYTIVFKSQTESDTADSTNTIGITKNSKHELKIEKEKLIVIISIIIISLIAFISSINSYKQRKILMENGLIKKKEKYTENDFDESQEVLDENQITEEAKEEKQDKDYINDIFENKQMQFEADDNDFMKRKKKKGKHSQD